MKIGLGIDSNNKIKANVRTSDNYNCKAYKDLEKKQKEEREKIIFEINKRN